ncbi:hypothetical protein CR513_37529, partial [Mucuna pruriens]
MVLIEISQLLQVLRQLLLFSTWSLLAIITRATMATPWMAMTKWEYINTKIRIGTRTRSKSAISKSALSESQSISRSDCYMDFYYNSAPNSVTTQKKKWWGDASKSSGDDEKKKDENKQNELVYFYAKEPNNWTAIELPLNKRQKNRQSQKNNDVISPCYDIDDLVNQTDEESTNLGSLVELERILERKNQEIQPHKENIGSINLGLEKEKREIKMGKSMWEDVRQNLVSLLAE